MEGQQFSLRWNNHQKNLLTVFDQLLQNEAFVDVTLACDGLSIKAHKMVLSACSPYFQSLFIDNPCQHPIVILKDVGFSELKAVVDFMYKGEVNVCQDQLSALLKTAETLKVKGLAEVSGKSNTETITPAKQSPDKSSDERESSPLEGGQSPPEKKKRRLIKRRSSEESESKVEGGDSPVKVKKTIVLSTKDESADLDLTSMSPNNDCLTLNETNDNPNNSWDSESSQHATNLDDSKVKSSNDESLLSNEPLNDFITSDQTSAIPANIASWASEQFLPPSQQTHSNSASTSTPVRKRGRKKSNAKAIKDEFFRCTLCSKAFNDSKSLIEHSNLHLQRFECDVCGTCFANQRDLRRHEHRHIPIHMREPQFECQECGKRFHNQGSLVNHRNVHKERFKCDLCGHCSQSKVMLEKHMRIHL